jgi:hypothetical protein
MKAPDRVFESAPAVRTQVPLWVGLMGPSGGGKTYSALEIATGIQSVRGGDVYYIDTEASRALHYADYFKFQHVPFAEPFGALDYLAAIKFCYAKGASVIVVDSMSHEHEGPGGLLEQHEAELDRMAGDDWRKREAVKMLAWNKPKQARRRLVQSMLQMNTCFILCFRAKDSSKPVKKDGKTEVVHLGFVPIAGDEFVFEMTVNALLLPGANGVPTWNAEHVGEQVRVKRPRQFATLFADGKPLTRDHGVALAEWAKGGAAARQDAREAAQPSVGILDRVKAFEGSLRNASTPLEVESVWRKGAKLRQEVDPPTLDRMALLYEARKSELSEVAK